MIISGGRACGVVRKFMEVVGLIEVFLGTCFIGFFFSDLLLLLILGICGVLGMGMWK